MDEPPPIPQKKKSRFGKRTLASIGIFMGVAFILILLHRRDIAPIDDSDLAIPDRVLTSEDNPYEELQSLDLSPEDSAELKELFQKHTNSEDIKFALLDELRNRHRDSLVAMEQAANRQPWKVTGELRIDSTFPELDVLMSLTNLLSLHGISASERGELDNAIATAKTLLHFGKEMQAAQGTLLHHLVGLAIVGRGQNLTAKILSQNEVEKTRLLAVSEILTDSEFDTGGFEDALRVEYQNMKPVFDDIAAGKIDIGELNSAVPSPTLSRKPSSLLFNKNRTILLRADITRDMIREAADIRSTTPETAKMKCIEMRLHPIKIWFTRNPVGKILISISMPAYIAINDKNAQVRTNNRLLILQAALARYRVDHNKWPASLDALVPTYLEAIPIDLMDGESLRYDPENLRIYSVGMDFIDSNAVAEKPGHLADRNEPVIYLEGVKE